MVSPLVKLKAVDPIAGIAVEEVQCSIVCKVSRDSGNLVFWFLACACVVRMPFTSLHLIVCRLSSIIHRLQSRPKHHHILRKLPSFTEHDRTEHVALQLQGQDALQT